MAYPKRDLTVREADSLRRDPRGGSDYIELLILLGAVALAALVGITVFGESVSKLFDKEADHVATMTAWVPGGQPAPGSGTPLGPGLAPPAGQAATPGAAAAFGAAAGAGSGAASGGAKTSLPVVIASDGNAAGGSQPSGSQAFGGQPSGGQAFGGQPLVANATTKAGGPISLLTARSGNAGTIAVDPPKPESKPITPGQALGALGELIGKHPAAAVLGPVLTNPAADGTLDGNPGATPYPNNVPQQQAPFPSDYPSSSAPAPTAEEVNSGSTPPFPQAEETGNTTPPFPQAEETGNTTPPFPADEPTIDSTPFPADEPTIDSTPFPQAEETGNTTPPFPGGAEPGIDPADPNAPVGNSNSDGTPVEGAIPITQTYPDDEPELKPGEPDPFGPENNADDNVGLLQAGDGEESGAPAAPTDTGAEVIPCDPDTDPDSCGATFDEGFPGDSTDNAGTANTDTDTDEATDVAPCDPDTDPDSCGATFDEGFPGDSTDNAGTANTDTDTDEATDVAPCDPDTDPDSCGATFDEGFPDDSEAPAEESEADPNSCFGFDCEVVGAVGSIGIQAILGNDEAAISGIIALGVASANDLPVGPIVQAAIFYGGLLEGGLNEDDLPGLIGGPLGAQVDGILEDGLDAEDIPAVIGIFSPGAGVIAQDIANGNYLSAVFATAGYLVFGDLGAQLGSLIGSFLGSDGPSEDELAAARRAVGEKLRQVLQQVRDEAAEAARALVQAAADEGRCDELPEFPEPPPTTECGKRFVQARDALAELGDCVHPTNPSHLSFLPANSQGPIQGGLWLDVPPAGESECSVKAACLTQEQHDESVRRCEEWLASGGILCLARPPVCGPPDSRPDCETIALTDAMAQDSAVVADLKQRCSDTRIQHYRDGPYTSAQFPTDPFGLWWDENFGEECRNEVIGDAAVYDGTDAIEFNDHGRGFENPHASQYDRVNAHFTGTGKWSSFSADPWGTLATATVAGADVSSEFNQLLKANATAAFQDAYVDALKQICGR